MGQMFLTTSPLKEHTRFAAQNSCVLMGRVTTKFVKRIVKFWGMFFVLFLPV